MDKINNYDANVDIESHEQSKTCSMYVDDKFYRVFSNIEKSLESIENCSTLIIEVDYPFDSQLLIRFRNIRLGRYHPSLNIPLLIDNIKYIYIEDDTNYKNINFTEIHVECSITKLKQLIQESNIITHVCIKFKYNEQNIADRKYYKKFIPMLNDLQYLKLIVYCDDCLKLFKKCTIPKMDLVFISYTSAIIEREIINLGIFESIYFSGNRINIKTIPLDMDNYTTKEVIPIDYSDIELNQMLERNRLVYEKMRFARVKALPQN